MTRTIREGLDDIWDRDYHFRELLLSLSEVVNLAPGTHGRVVLFVDDRVFNNIGVHCRALCKQTGQKYGSHKRRINLELSTGVELEIRRQPKSMWRAAFESLSLNG